MRFLQSTTRALALAALVCVCLSAAAQNKPIDVHEFAEKVDKRYNSIGSLEAKFTEVYRGGGMSRTESGTMYLKKPGKMRWDYSVPREKVFVTDGKNAWFYVPGEKQARRASVKDLDDLRSPLRYLLGKTKLEKEFEGLSLAPDVTPSVAGNTVLRGVPKSMADRVSQVQLEITPEYRIARIYIEELDGSSTEFRFSDQKDNVALADQRFKFSPPAGVEVMEAKELEP
jgi:outer membrane lipoprotein carrier protein